MEAVPLCHGKQPQRHSSNQVRQCTNVVSFGGVTNCNSWDYVKKEKSEDMIHVLQFPYNGEPPRVILTSS